MCATLAAMNPVDFLVAHRLALLAALGVWLLLWYWGRQRLTPTQQWVDDRLRWVEAFGVLALLAWFLYALFGGSR